MADVDGTPVLDGTTLYATSFKKQTIAIDAPSGRPMWASEHGGAGRVGVASDRVVVTDPAGTVFGLDKASGSALWQQPALARRNLTGAGGAGRLRRGRRFRRLRALAASSTTASSPRASASAARPLRGRAGGGRRHRSSCRTSTAS